jgi:plasmid stabilization system protein ParE
LALARQIPSGIANIGTEPAALRFCPENRKLKRDLRQYLFGRKPNVYRAVFVIDGEVVRIIRIRHAARRWMKPGDLQVDDG